MKTTTLWLKTTILLAKTTLLRLLIVLYPLQTRPLTLQSLRPTFQPRVLGMMEKLTSMVWVRPTPVLLTNQELRERPKCLPLRVPRVRTPTPTSRRKLPESTTSLFFVYLLYSDAVQGHMLRRLEEEEPQRIEESLRRALETTNEGTEKGMLRSVLVASYRF